MSAPLLGEGLIDDLAEALQIPPARYESADRSYRSVCAWLERPESLFNAVDLDVYTQGSFRLGTAIKPVNGEEHYDLDIVCEFKLGKATITQAQLHAALGLELRLYAAKHGMQEPSPWDRCWTLNYADEAQFHMDVLPSVPDGQRQRQFRELASVSLEFVDQSISITDAKHQNFYVIDDDWPASNPNGYAEWFFDRMRPVFESRRAAMAVLAKRADVADIPTYQVRTPLQQAIQILKRHRDMRFADEPEYRPTSIVITTLAAHSYGQETSTAAALLSILTGMESAINKRGETWWIANPSDPRENFADSWNDEPARANAFFDWLETARADFDAASKLADPAQFVDALAPRIGRNIVEAAVQRRHSPGGRAITLAASRTSRAMRRILDAPHRRPSAWPNFRSGSVQIIMATAMHDGFRPTIFSSDDTPIFRGSKLRFDSRTDVPRPFEVYWQVVNTGEVAARKRDLRGEFYEGSMVPGVLSWTEDAVYPGSHSIECFIIKNGLLAARSEPFIVNIA